MNRPRKKQEIQSNLVVSQVIWTYKAVLKQGKSLSLADSINNKKRRKHGRFG
jgi:hypothetical protein